MFDQRLSRMLRRAGEEPSQEFVANLRRDLLADLGDTPTQTSTRRDPAADPLARDRPDDGYIPLRNQPPAAHRRRWPVLVAAAVLVVAGTVAVITRHRAPGTLKPASTVPHSFSQPLSVDVKTPAGANLHVEGTVALPLAVESNESSIQPMHDVLLLPTLEATVTNQDGQPVTIAHAYVEIFLRGDRSGCVVNSSGCETALITGRSEDGTSPTVLGAGGVLPLSVAGKSSRISVPAGEVEFTIDQVHDGSMVVGYAVVVQAGAAGDDVASVVFDRSGRSVLKCAAAPDDCLGPERAALGDDAAPARSAAGAGAGLPPGALAPGVHASTDF